MNYIKNFIYYTILAFIGSAVILFLHYFHSAQYNIHAFDLNSYTFVLAIMLAVIILVIACSMLLDFFHEKDMQKADERTKQILHMHLAQSLQKISYPFPWRHILRTVFILLIFAPFVFLPLPTLTLMLINNPPTASADKSWIGILLLCAIALFALIMWLQKLAFFIYKAYHAHKKGFFLYADSKGLEHCLFPAIAWQHVQSISPENIKDPNFTHYGMSVTLHATWIQQHPISRW